MNNAAVLNMTTLQAVGSRSAHTAVQLRLTALPSQRGFGGAVWVGSASITAL